MSRTKAIKELDFDAELSRLEGLGIVHSLRSKKDLDEAPSAYKDIHMVMADQHDLVDIVTELTPLAVIKG